MKDNDNVVSIAEIGRVTQATRQSTAPPISRRRLWLFKIIAAIVIPALLFSLLEITLRALGYGYPASALVKSRLDGKDVYCSNYKFGWRFFPPQLSREFNPFVLPAQKSDKTYRIFVFGGSAAQSTPDKACSSGKFLRAMLRQHYPEVNFEVINTAMPAVNSHVIRQIAKDCAKHQPDLFVLYMGNNEVVGPYGPGTIFSPFTANISLIRLGIAVKATRLGQLLADLAQVAARQNNTPDVWNETQMFIDKQVCPDDPRLDTVYRHFRTNLEDIITIASRSGAKVILCTVGSNLKDWPPFASLHRADLTEANIKKWNDIYNQAVRLENAGNYPEAIQMYLAASAVDDSYADLLFRLARCHWQIADYDKAAHYYLMAQHCDTLHFRPCSPINDTIRSVACNQPQQTVFLADVAKTFAESSPHQIPGRELFLDHVHMNFTGNYLLARTVLEQVQKALPQQIKKHKAAYCPPLTENLCAQLLAYSIWDKYTAADKMLNNIKHPPCTNQLYHTQRIQRRQQELDALKAGITPRQIQLTADQHRRAIEIDDSNWWLRWKYGQLLHHVFSNTAAAAEQYRLVLKYVPHFSAALVDLALIEGKNGNVETAAKLLEKAVKITPANVTAQYNLAFAYATQRKTKRAIHPYSEVLKLQPSYAPAYINLAALFYRLGKVDRAEQIYKKGLLAAPDNSSLHYKLAMLLKEKGQIDEAKKELRAALEFDPNSIDSRRALQLLSAPKY